MSIKRIAISTGGGDAPGLNVVIRAIVLSAVNRGWRCFGIRDGYNGLMLPEQFPQGGLLPLNRDSVRGITHVERRRFWERPTGAIRCVSPQSRTMDRLWKQTGPMS